MVDPPVMTQRRMVNDLKDRLVGITVWAAAGLIFGLLAWILVDVLVRGASQLSLEFVFGNQENAGRAGGIATIIVSTSLLLAVTLLVAVPLSLATAIGLAENTRDSTWSGTAVRRSLMCSRPYLQSCSDYLATPYSVLRWEWVILFWPAG